MSGKRSLYGIAIITQSFSVFLKIAISFLLIWARYSHQWIINNHFSDDYFLTRDIFNYDCGYMKDNGTLLTCIESGNQNSEKTVFYETFDAYEDLVADPLNGKFVHGIYIILIILSLVDFGCSFAACCGGKNLLPEYNYSSRKNDGTAIANRSDQEIGLNKNGKFFIVLFIIWALIAIIFLYILKVALFDTPLIDLSRAAEADPDIFGHSFYVFLSGFVAFVLSVALMVFSVFEFIRGEDGTGHFFKDIDERSVAFVPQGSSN